MIITVPLVVDSTVLTSSSVPEPDASQGELLWSPGTSYAKGNEVVRPTTHRRYVRLEGGSSVDATLPELAPLMWEDIGPTNRYAMFQHDRNTQTVGAAGVPLVVELALGRRVDTFALLGLEAGSARVQMIVGTGPSERTVYDQAFGLMRRNTRTWSDYFFGGFRQVKNMLRHDLPPYANARLRVTLFAGASPVRCAGLVVNKSVYIGVVKAGAVSDARNFSEFERDKWGGAKLNRQRSVPNGAYTIYAAKVRAEEIQELRDEELNGVAALYSGLDDKSSDGFFGLALVFGVYTQFSISMDHPDHAVITLKVEEF